MIGVPDITNGFLHDTVAALVMKFRPHCIFLFGSRARGDHRADSDYDLYMEVSCENWPAEVRHTEDGFLLGYHPAEIHVRVPGWLTANESDPSRVMYDVAREGVLLYAEPGFKQVTPSHPAPRIGPMMHRNALIQAEWLCLGRLELELLTHLEKEVKTWKAPLCEVFIV